MPEYIPPLTTCENCGGDGLINGDICTSCFGNGALPLQAKDKLISKLIADKLDNIIVEQASQREDLTNALTRIWDKVKDL